MAASVSIYRWCGTGSGTAPSLPGGDLTAPPNTTRANAMDQHSTSDTSNPIQIPDPAKPSNWSYWVNTRLHVDSTPSGVINNVRWYVQGTPSLGAGINCWVAQAISYAQAVGTPGQTGNKLLQASYGTNYLIPLPLKTAQWSQMSNNVTSAPFPVSNTYTTVAWDSNGTPTYSADNPMLIFVGPVTPTLVTGSVSAGTWAAITSTTPGVPSNTWCNLVVYQIEVTSSATAGATSAVTFVWKYDET